MLHGLYIISLKSYSTTAKNYWPRICQSLDYTPELFTQFCDWYFTYVLNRILTEMDYQGNAPHHQRFIKSDWYELFPKSSDLKDIINHLEQILKESLWEHVLILHNSREINTMFLGDSVVIGRLE